MQQTVPWSFKSSRGCPLSRLGLRDSHCRSGAPRDGAEATLGRVAEVCAVRKKMRCPPEALNAQCRCLASAFPRCDGENAEARAGESGAIDASRRKKRYLRRDLFAENVPAPPRAPRKTTTSTSTKKSRRCSTILWVFKTHGSLSNTRSRGR